MANAIALIVLRAGARESLNVKGAYLEVSATSSVGRGGRRGLIIALTGWVGSTRLAAIRWPAGAAARLLLFRETATC